MRLRPEHALGRADLDTSLGTNTTEHLIGDMEKLGIDRRLIWGGSWGVTLRLAYAERYPELVTEMARLAYRAAGGHRRAAPLTSSW